MFFKLKLFISTLILLFFNSKSISKNGGHAFYRGLLKVTPGAYNVKATVNCESLMLDSDSRSDTLPIIEVMNDKVDIGHEAKIGRISDDTIFCRGVFHTE